MSVSISDSSSSADSVAVGRIQNMNRDLMEMVNSRLTAFFYFNNLSHSSAQESLQSSINSLEDMKNSIKKEIEELNQSPSNILVVSQVLKQIIDLQKLHQDELKKLRSYHEEIHTLNNEEGELNERLSGIEKHFNRLVLEEKSEHAACNCFLF
jgi:DNA repair ATPase RecN